MKRRQWAGLSVLVIVGLIVFLFQRTDWNPDPTPGPTAETTPPTPESIVVNGLWGGKDLFWAEPEVVRILKEKYGLTVTGRRVASIEMEQQCKANAGLDFCWPSNQNSARVIKDNLPPGSYVDKVIFHTPIVFYSWPPIVDALITQGIVEKRGDIYYVSDFPKLVQVMLDGKKWSEIGVIPKLYGKVFVKTSDPGLSTTGNSFVGLVANTLNGSEVVELDTAANVIPQLQALFGGVLLPENTTKLWEDYLTKGIGDSPIIAAIESNLIEYCLANPEPDVQEYIRQELVMLYPEPTVLTSHPLIAMTDGGKRLMEALRDPDIQKIGWEKHAFRSGVPGIPNNPVCTAPGIRTDIVDSVISMPLPAVMNQLVLAINSPSAPEAINTPTGTPRSSTARSTPGASPSAASP